MSHLPSERLAALVDEAPSADEALHLAACTECARERAMFQSLSTLAANESARIGTPLTKWETLRPALVADGVIDSGRGVPSRTRHAQRPWLQAAAAVLLVAGGVMGGRFSAGASVVPNSTHSTGAVASAGAPSSLSSTNTNDSMPTFRSVDDALAAQERSQLLYQSATAFLAQRDTSSRAGESAASMRARLAALDQANQVMGAALTEAPYDPVINGYYLTTLGQREATLRQINTTMPASMRVNSY